MSDRHDLRRQIREIREALSRFPPEQLVDICTHIFRQYVMDGAAPAPATMQTQDELAGLSFAQVIERLQLRLDLPELRQFEIHGGRVGVKVDGRVVAIDSPDGRAEALPAMRGPQIQQVQVHLQPAAPSPQPSPASPGTESRETTGAAPPGVAPVGHSGSARPDGTARPAPARAAAATPAARPMASPAASAGPAAAAGPGRPAAAPSPAPAAAPAKPAPPEKPEASPGGRFNLLEID